MTEHLLLVGAGFSRNWGGWLAAEVFESLIGDVAIQGDPELKQLLWKYQIAGGFEDALGVLQRDQTPGGSARRLALESAVARIFGHMNAAYRRQSLELGHVLPLNDMDVRGFLLRFKAIFSLNQDLLLETLYRGSADGSVDRSDPRTERSWELPGMRLLPAAEGQVIYPSALGTWVPTSEHLLSGDSQPIFKLHGSSNWRSAEGSDLMILGGGKADAIEQQPILRWYAKVLSEWLCREGSRLMIIGYGFADEHINNVLLEALGKGLKIFIVDPQGAEVAGATNRVPVKAAGYRLTPLQEGVQASLIGASRRPLQSIFSSDVVERAKLMRFFES